MNIGDTVSVWKWVYDRQYVTTGIVEKISNDPIRGEMLLVNGDWWVNTNDETHKCKLVKRAMPQPKHTYESMDVSSGIGIGGYGSDDYNIWTEHDTISHPERDGCKWGGTRYDEACANCGRITAICNDCELCENCHG